MSISVYAGVQPSGDDARDAYLDKILEASFTDGYTFPRVDMHPCLPPPTFDQGNTNICVSNSVAVLMSWLFQKKTFSRYFLYQLRETCRVDAGMSFRDALRIAHKFGIAPVSAYPDTNIYVNARNPAPQDRLSDSVMREASRYKLLAYGRVASLATAVKIMDLSEAYQRKHFMATETVAQMMDPKILAITKAACAGPLMLVIPIYNGGAMPWKPSSIKDTLQGYHGVQLIVSDIATQSGTVCNSWGIKWNNGNTAVFPWSDWNCVLECWFGTNDPIFAQRVYEQVKLQTNWNYRGDGNLSPDNHVVALGEAIPEPVDANVTPFNDNLTAVPHTITSNVIMLPNPLEQINRWWCDLMRATAHVLGEVARNLEGGSIAAIAN